jgi:hypothetical protein
MPIIPATWDAEIGRITVPGQPWQKKVHKTPLSTEKSWACGMHLSLQLQWETYKRGSWPRLAWEKTRLYLKTKQNKKGWRCGSSSTASA